MLKKVFSHNILRAFPRRNSNFISTKVCLFYILLNYYFNFVIFCLTESLIGIIKNISNLYLQTFNAPNSNLDTDQFFILIYFYKKFF